MFDSVYAKCPECKNPEVEFQSKAGHCRCDNFKSTKVPVVIAKDLDGATTRCLVCGAIVTLSTTSLPEYIRMDVD